MARTTIVQVTDDIDGSPNAAEVTFSFDGVDYVIDLNKKNRAGFEKALKPYVDAARKAPSRSASRRSGPPANNPRQDLNAVRAWAKENNIKVSNRGRIAGSVLEQYAAAH